MCEAARVVSVVPRCGVGVVGACMRKLESCRRSVAVERRGHINTAQLTWVLVPSFCHCQVSGVMPAVILSCCHGLADTVCSRLTLLWTRDKNRI